MKKHNHTPLFFLVDKQIEHIYTNIPRHTYYKLTLNTYQIYTNITMHINSNTHTHIHMHTPHTPLFSLVYEQVACPLCYQDTLA